MTVGQTLRPYPYFLNVDHRGAFVGRTNYHSVQVRVEKRFRGGGVISANYTWSRAKGNTDTDKGYLESGTGGRIQNFYDLDAEYGLSSYDVPHRFVVSFVLDLPFGKGKRFASGVAGRRLDRQRHLHPPDRLPIEPLRPRHPLTTYFGSGRIRPNIVSGCDPDLGSDQSYEHWFNTACWSPRELRFWQCASEL